MGKLLCVCWLWGLQEKELYLSFSSKIVDGRTRTYIGEATDLQSVSWTNSDTSKETTGLEPVNASSKD